jgi:alpha-tubulin suppressor-like RCC1 family protein
MIVGLLGCEVSRVPELAPEGGVDNGMAGASPMGGNGGMQGGMPGGGFGGQMVPNPCAFNRGGCSQLVQCTNNDGVAECGECPEGTQGDGTSCDDIDECAEGLDDCDDDPAAMCVNTPFTFACRCPMGTRDFGTMGRNCEVIENPMSGGIGGQPTGGMTGGTSGVGGPGPVNECALGTDDCDDSPAAACTDTPTSYACACPAGYQDLNTGGRNCVDIDECAEDTDECDDSPEADCNDTDGSYTCDCPDGYTEASNGHDCEDFDDCSLPNDCDDDPDACVDGEGTYTCECPEGYTDFANDGSDCRNDNECMAGTDLCDPDAECEDTPGGYDCTCPGGDAEDVLGDGHACTSPETRVAMGNSHTCVIDVGGAVKCWGQGFNGQLGLGNAMSRGATPGQTGDFFTAADLGGRAIAIAGGCSHNCALLENGDVKCWGLNHRGQLGQNDTVNRGDGPNEMGDNLDPVPLGMPAIAVTAGCEYSCALLEDNNVKCWGTHEYGQIGTGVSPGVDPGMGLPLPATFNYGDAPGEMEALTTVPLGGTVQKIRGGFRFVCALMADDSLKCWGRNNNGQLGKNDVNHRGDAVGEMGASLTRINLGMGRVVRDFAPGYIHVCARLDNNQVKCWGSGGFQRVMDAVNGPCPATMIGGSAFFNYIGSIGYGDNAFDPCGMGINRGDMFEQHDERDDMNNEMGDTLDVVPLANPPVSMTSGHHTCMAFADGRVSCFGINRIGQLGLGHLESIGDGPDEMGAALPFVSLGANADVIQVFTGQEDTAGFARSCALFADGRLKCWGSNNVGSLGLGDQLTRGDEPNEMGDSLPASFDLW